MWAANPFATSELSWNGNLLIFSETNSWEKGNKKGRFKYMSQNKDSTWPQQAIFFSWNQEEGFEYSEIQVKIGVFDVSVVVS